MGGGEPGPSPWAKLWSAVAGTDQASDQGAAAAAPVEQPEPHDLKTEF